MRLLLAPLLLGLASLACGGAQRADDSDWTPEVQQKPRHLREAESINAPQPLDPNEKAPTAVIGVRHDLMLSNAPHEARCACLSVEIGRADDPGFFWAGGAPTVGPDSLAVALGARGIACPGGDPDDRRRRPSISAVDVEGDDIVVEVEDLPQGRPLASGAIIPGLAPRGPSTCARARATACTGGARASPAAACASRARRGGHRAGARGSCGRDGGGGQPRRAPS